MFNKISLQNFKSFKKLDEIELKNITIIAGKNSCGKSSILQSMLLLKQTVESSSESPLCLEGKYIKCSNIKELAFGLPPINQAKFGYEFFFEDKSSVEISFKNKSVDGSYIPVLDSNIHKIFKDNEIVKLSNDVTKTKLTKLLDKMNFPVDVEKIISYETIYKKFTPSHVEIKIETDDEGPKTINLPIFFFSSERDELNSKLINSLKNIRYLSPVRAIPERAYVHYSEDASELNEDGSNAAHILWSKKNSLVKWKGKTIKLKDALNDCISCMGLSQQISPDKVGDILYKVGIKEDISGANVSLADVGFGYSQIIPVILLGLINDSNNLMLLEQPEIHLHPSSAANLADLFINFAKDDKKFVIETHSQELINRLRLRVIENPELKDKINIVFIESNSELGAQATQFEIDDNGMFPSWPDGFLDESKKLADAIINARLAKADDEW